MASLLDVRNMTRRATPRHPYARVSEKILPGWNLSLVFVGTKRAKSLNKTLRGKSYAPNVLSYQTGKNSGEILICLDTLAREAPAYALTPKTYCLYLFIHGCLHLKGMPHGPTMERRERELLSRFVT